MPDGSIEARGDILVADEADRLRHRSNPGDAVLGDLLREVRILREEAVARVDGIGARLERCAQDRVFIQVAVRGIGAADADGVVGQLDVKCILVCFREDGNGLDVELFAGADDAHRNLAAIGDQNAFEHRGIPPVSQYYDSRYYNQLLILNLP